MSESVYHLRKITFDVFFVDVNYGEKILIRLRPASAPDTFYEENDLVGTMLHEVRPSRRLIHSLHSCRVYSSHTTSTALTMTNFTNFSLLSKTNTQLFSEMDT